MTLSNPKRQKKQKKYIDELKKELLANDTIFKKNIDEHKTQVQIGLYKSGLPQGSPMYDTLIEKMTLDIEAMKLQLETKLKVVNPTYAYQTNERWLEIQNLMLAKSLAAHKANLIEIKKNVDLVEQLMLEQQERIKARRTQILDELKKLDQDVSDFAKPTYFG